MPTIGAYVSDEEFDRAKKIAEDNNMTVSQVVRNAFNNLAITDQSIELERINTMKNLSVNMKRIGENLNQITTHLHVNKVVDRQLYFTIEEIKKDIKAYL